MSDIGKAALPVAGLLTLFLIVNFCLGEKIYANNGLGYDGVNYAYLTKNLPSQLFEKRISPLYVGRIIPCGLVYAGLKVAGSDFSDISIIHGFEVLNSMLLVVGVFLFAATARRLSLSRKQMLWGMAMVFGNYAILKWVPYYPVLTDAAGFTLGLVLAYFYFSNNMSGMFLVAAVGLYTWPSIFYLCAPLILFPRGEVEPAKPPLFLNWIAGGAVASFFTFGTLYVYVTGGTYVVEASARGVEMHSAILLTLVVLFALVFTASKYVWDAFPETSFSSFFSLSFISRLLGLAVLWWGSAWLQGYLVGGQPNEYGLLWHFNRVFTDVMKRPLLFWVGHVVFFGPAIVILSLEWKHICRQAQRCGLGMCLVLTLVVVGLVNPLARQNIPFFSFLCVFASFALNFNYRKSFVVFYGVAAFVGSMVWLWINQGVTPAIVESRMFMEFPLQKLFMGQAPYMNDETYFVFLFGYLGFVLFAYFLGQEKDGALSDNDGSGIRSVSIAPDVELGEGVMIHHPQLINMYGCRIGDDSRVGAFVEIQKGVSIGKRCKISTHSFLCEGVHIDDDVFIGHGVTFINDCYPQATSNGRPQTEDDWEVIPTRVEKGASIGSGATILCGVTIGREALVGAGSVVLEDVPPQSIVVGAPAKVVRYKV